MDRIPQEWLPRCRMDRVIYHWTGGGHRASNLDKLHYHILVEADGNLVRGKYSIAANAPVRSGKGYAAHTRLKNSWSIGVSCCCMLNARQRPFNVGDAPMKKKQWQVMAEVIAQLCKVYNISVLPTTVLAHGEVQPVLHVQQRGKWDPLALPWDRSKKPKEVGAEFRDKVQHYLKGTQLEDQEPTFEVHSVTIRDKTFTDAILENGSAFVPIDPVMAAFGATIKGRDDLHLKVLFPSGNQYKVPYTEYKDKLLVDCKDLALIFELTLTWNPRKKTIVMA